MIVTAARRRAGLVLLATLIAVAVTARLGFWQLSRAAQKVALQTQLDSRSALTPLDGAALGRSADAAAAQHYRRARLRGHWVDGHTVSLDNRQMNGLPGFYVVTPFQLDGEPDAVLVQRGWAPRDVRDRTLLPAVATPSAVVLIEGLIAPPPARLYQFSTESSGLIRQNLDIADFARETGLQLLPMSVLQRDSPSTTGDGLLRRWSLPAVDVQMHYGYAFQWFSIAVLMAGLYVWFQLIRPGRPHGD